MVQRVLGRVGVGRRAVEEMRGERKGGYSVVFLAMIQKVGTFHGIIDDKRFCLTELYGMRLLQGVLRSDVVTRGRSGIKLCYHRVSLFERGSSTTIVRYIAVEFDSLHVMLHVSRLRNCCP